MKNYSAISEMYYGNRGNNENIKLNNEEKIALDELVKTEEKFFNLLSNAENLTNVYQELISNQMKLNALSCEKAYSEGFRFGFLMAMDVFSSI